MAVRTGFSQHRSWGQLDRTIVGNLFKIGMKLVWKQSVADMEVILNWSGTDLAPF
ncbi:unnamed protein product [Protopolystoma xenopodis]|uniref:Uncharacterized protein n=1 Tax=Protopolystoma xenopodis TaxID=117903 RepID=A0A3S5FFE5_9PLAT|nr:unnamed protein product [Protopolystoma xenopodis]